MERRLGELERVWCSWGYCLVSKAKREREAFVATALEEDRVYTAAPLKKQMYSLGRW